MARTRHVAITLTFALALVVAPAIPASAAIFTDGFESGNTASWDTNVGAVVEGAGGGLAPAPEGSSYARIDTAGASAYLQKNVATTTDLFVDFRVNLASTGGITNLAQVVASGTNLATAKVSNKGALQIKNNVAGTTATSATNLTPGWTELQLHTRTGGSPLVELFLAGSASPLLTLTDTLGSSGATAVQLGHKGANSGFDAGFDAVTIDSAFIGGGGGPSAPATPGNLHLVSKTTTSITIAWNAVSNADGYGVYRGGSKLGGDVTSTTFTDTGLTPGQTYAYTVDAANVAGRSSATAPLLVTTDTTVTPPGVPTNLREVSHSTTTISIAWDAVANADGYGVYRNGSKLGGDVTGTTFNDTGLSPGTTYRYQVDAANTAGRSNKTTELVVTTTSSGGSNTVVMAAGDIACDPNDPNYNGSKAKYCQHRDTATLLSSADLVLAIGDTQYYCGGTQAYAQSYDPTWGVYKNKTYAIPADQEYATRSTEPTGTDCSSTANAAGYYQYFGARGGKVGAGSNAVVPGAYSVDVNGWHIVGLNSVCSAVGGCKHNQPMDDWLESDLAATNEAGCTIAMLHIPRFVSLKNGNKTNGSMAQLWETMYAGGVDIVLSGNSHVYERFKPQNVAGNFDAQGIVEMIVGTGGRGHGGLAAPGARFANSAAGQATSFGVMKLTLKSGSYDFQFLTAPGEPSFTDSGSSSCTNPGH